MFFRKKKKIIEEISNTEENINTISSQVIISEEIDIISTAKADVEDEILELINEEITDAQEESDENIAKDVKDEIIEDENSEEYEDSEEDYSYDKDAPIYILGDNALAYYLAARFMSGGEKVVLIPNKENISTLENNGITIVEGLSFQKSHYKFKTSFWLKEKPKMLIITSDAGKINAALTALSRHKLENVPVILFTPIRNTSYIKDILANDIYQAFFDGYLLKKPNQVNIFGRLPNIVICPKENKLSNRIIFDCFEKTNFTVTQKSDEKLAFWDYFSVYAACSLISAWHNKNIFDIIKDKDKRDNMIPLIVEICNIAASDGAKIDKEEVLRKVYSTPLNYPYPLQAELSQGKSGDIDLISTNLITTARQYKCPTTAIDAILKKIYNIIIK